MTAEELVSILEPARYVGRAPEQTAEFLAEEVQPVLDRYADQLGVDVDIKV